MHLKTRIAAGAVAVLTAGMLVIPASAHGGHHSSTQTQTTQTQPATVSVCSVKHCHTTGQHMHRGTTYCSYDHKSGFCDGTCIEALQEAAAVSTPTVTTGSHHGGRGHHSHH